MKQMILKLIFTVSLSDAQHERESVENKPTSLLVPLGKALSKILPSWRSRRMASNFYGSSLERFLVIGGK